MVVRLSPFAVVALLMLGEHPDAAPPVIHWQWARHAGGKANDWAQASCLDKHQDLIVTGRFQDTASFGKQVLSSAGENDIFVARYSPSGTCLGAQRFGGRGDDIGWGVAVDGRGSIYLVGSFSDSVFFGDTSLFSNGGSDLFLAKMDSSGQVLWIRQVGGAKEDIAYAVAVTGDNVVAAGSFAGSVEIDGRRTKSAGLSDIFIAEWDTAGYYQWLRMGGNRLEAAALACEMDKKGNVYVTGFFDSTISFGHTVLTSGVKLEDQSGSSWSNAFIAKLDSSGSVAWAREAGGSYYDEGTGIAPDERTGDVYVTGRIRGRAKFGGSRIQCGDSVFFCGMAPEPYAKGRLTYQGERFSCRGHTLICRDTEVVSNGEWDIFLAKYDSMGSVQWVRTAGGSRRDEGTSVAVDSKGHIYLAGYFSETAQFGPCALKSRGGWDIFAAEYNSVGACTWAAQAGGAGSDGAADIVPGPSGSLYITGGYTQTGSFGSDSLSSEGGEGIFVARLSTSFH
jgi:hypothetical protein